MFSFLHLGDLHLESPFAAFYASEAAARRARQYEALETLLRAGVDRGAQMVLISGDCFDTHVPRTDAVARFFGILETISVPVVIAPGNHDYCAAGSFWDAPTRPQNVFVFTSPALAAFDFPAWGVTVYGYAFTQESADAKDIGRAQNLREDRINLLLAHADLTSPLSSYAPLSMAQLEQSGYTYAALGHIHKQMPVKKCGATTVAYSGFFAGRGFDELGEGQARLVEIDGDALRECTLKSGADTFERRVLDCTGAEKTEQIRRAVTEYLKKEKVPSRTALRLVLEGDVGIDCHVEVAQLSSLDTGLALFEVQDRTLPLYDAAHLEKSPTVQGAFYRALLPRLQSKDADEREVAADALRLGLSALAGREV